MLDEHGLGNDRTDAARSCESADDDELMDEKKGQVAHAGMLSNVQIALDSGKFPNSPRTG